MKRVLIALAILYVAGIVCWFVWHLSMNTPAPIPKQSSASDSCQSIPTGLSWMPWICK